MGLAVFSLLRNLTYRQSYPRHKILPNGLMVNTLQAHILVANKIILAAEPDQAFENSFGLEKMPEWCSNVLRA